MLAGRVVAGDCYGRRAATQLKSPRWTVALFRAFYASRPDEERWELIDGLAVMMTPPSLAHQRIASNLQLLLNQALEDRFPTMTASAHRGRPCD
jgi:Uma2 family endonuclease